MTAVSQFGDGALGGQYFLFLEGHLGILAVAVGHNRLLAPFALVGAEEGTVQYGVGTGDAEDILGEFTIQIDSAGSVFEEDSRIHIPHAGHIDGHLGIGEGQLNVGQALLLLQGSDVLNLGERSHGAVHLAVRHEGEITPVAHGHETGHVGDALVVADPVGHRVAEQTEAVVEHDLAFAVHEIVVFVAVFVGHLLDGEVREADELVGQILVEVGYRLLGGLEFNLLAGN